MKKVLNSPLLKAQLKSGRLSHAYIFECKDEAHGLSMAEEFSKTVLCSTAKEGYCNQCALCRKFDAQTLSDFRIIRPEKQNIPIDAVRGIISDLFLRPLEATKKIILIDQAHLLRKEGANALLKTLEEPPSYAIIILLTNKKEKMIKTILSRCQIVSFPAPDAPSSEVDIPKLLNLIDRVLSGDLLCIFQSKGFFDEGKNQRIELLNRMEDFFRDIMVYKYTGDKTMLTYQKNFLKVKKHSEMDLDRLEGILQEIESVKQGFKVNVNYQLAMEHLLLYIGGSQ